jgi:phage recombination protein Bet
MNAITKIDDTPRAELIKVLQDSIWVGAQPVSIELALSYCRVNNLDPFLKPIHIVPVWDKALGRMRDVLMPGIADYRIKAARSGEYVGITEPEFGPDVTSKWGTVVVTHPEWCKITVYRMVAGKERAFSAREEWLENFAAAGGKERAEWPNTMWRKRPKGQLAKCAESQALRKAFPEFAGGQATAEEMEGKTFEGTTLDGSAEPAAETAKARHEATAARATATTEPVSKNAAPTEKTRQTVDALINKIAACESPEEWLDYDSKSTAYREKLRHHHPDLAADLDATFEEKRLALFPEPEPETAAQNEGQKDDLLGGIDDEPPPDPDWDRALAMVSTMETASTRKELDAIKTQNDNAAWLKSIRSRKDIEMLLTKSYADATERLGTA